jgi:hypothetical protein
MNQNHLGDQYTVGGTWELSLETKFDRESQKKWDQRAGSDKAKKVGVKWGGALDQSDGWKVGLMCF